MPILSDAQLARVRQLLSNNSGYVDPAGFVEGGLRIQPLLDNSGASGEAYSNAPGAFIGVIVYPEGQTQVGKPFHLFGVDGSFRGTFEFRDNNISVLAGIAMVVGAAFAFTAIGNLAAAGAGTGTTGATAGEVAATSGASQTMAPLELMSTAGLEPLPYLAGPAAAGGVAAAAGGGLSSLLSTGAGLLKTGLGIAATLAGIQGQRSGSQAGSVPVSGVTPGDGPFGLSWPMFGIVALGVAGLTYLIAKD